MLREIRDGMRIVARSPVLRALALSHGGTHILWGIFGTSYLLFAIERARPRAGRDRRHRRRSAASARWPAPRSRRVMVRRFGIGQTILLGMLGFMIGNALIPLAPGAARVARSGAAFLIAQQLIGDSLATVYEVTEVSLVQASVGDRLLGRVNATIRTFTTLLTLAGAVARRRSSPRPGASAPAFAIGLLGGVLSRSSSSGSRRSGIIRDAPLVPTHRHARRRAADHGVAATPVGAPGRARATPHPRNTLNELSGEEWLYFTKSVWTTAYPSELGHALRKAARREQAAAADGPADRVLHEARRARPRPVRRRRRDAARRGDRARAAAGARASSSSPRWAEVYAQVVDEALRGARRRRARRSPTSARTIPAARAASTRPAASCASATRSTVLPTLAAESVDFVATDPPYNVQLPMTMSGGALAEAFANRRTDYAMVTDDPADLANAADYPAFLDRMTEVLARARSASSSPAATPS